MSFTRKSTRYFALVVLLLMLAACRPALTQPTAFPTNIPATLTPLPTPSPIPAQFRPTPTSLSTTDTEALAKAFASAWEARDPVKLLSFYSHDVKIYDALGQGQLTDYLTIQDVLSTELVKGVFSVKFNSYFISDDARFAVMVGTFTQQSNEKTLTQPYVSLLEYKAGLIIRVLNYYGGVSSKGLPLQTIPASASQPVDSAQAITDVQNLIVAWETAYNTKDIQKFLSFYADKLQYTQVVSPDWRVFTKNKLVKEMTARFSSLSFKSGLSSFIVSADGHYAAVQGLYTDERTNNTPMLMILQIQDGKIVQQYDYLVY